MHIILSGGPGNGAEACIPDNITVYFWYMAHGHVEYRPLVIDGLTLPVWSPGLLIPNPHYNPHEPF